METRRIAVTALLVPVACVLAAGAEWKPAEGPLMTRWAKDVSPGNVWPEYPRPQMVRKEWVNLNGLWDYAITGKDEGRPARWQGRILVPFCAESALSGVMKAVKPDQALWYHRAIARPALPEGHRLLLHFGAVDWHATVWVNGVKLGEHKGGYEPFTFDITKAAGTNRNAPDEIVMRVWDPTDKGFQPKGKQVLNPRGIMYTAVTGIWQTAWLETVPPAHITGLKITPDVDKGSVTVLAEVAGKADEVEVAVSGEKLGASGAELEFDGPVKATVAGAAGKPVTVRGFGKKLWTPDEPFLYGLTVTLKREGKEIDKVDSYFAMRKIGMRKDEAGVNRLFLNDELLFQYGPLDQGWWPDGLYTAPCDEALQHDIEVTKKLGMNMCRKHVKVEHARFYYWADRLGLLVWQDMASGSNKGEEGKANFEKELRAMIAAFRNHPSIVMWVPFNEGWGQHDTPRYVDLIKKLDPSRLVNNASGWTDRGVGDVRDVHKYPGPGTAPVEEDRAIVLGEFGGLGLQVEGHMWRKDKNWGYRSFKSKEELTKAYAGLLHRLHNLIGGGLAAAVYTQTSDVEIEVNGLMTYDRAMVKPDFERAAEAAKKLYLPPPVIKPLVPDSQKKAQTWRYTTEPPGDGWNKPDFDDSGWKEGPGGFGTKATPGAVVRTEWSGNEIWLRRRFELAEKPGEIQLRIHHDEDAEVFLNGVEAAKLGGYTADYLTVPIRPEALKALRKGGNTIAILCRQTGGGQYIDAGLVAIEPR